MYAIAPHHYLPGFQKFAVGAADTVGDILVQLLAQFTTDALARGLMDAGTDVLDIGLSGTEEIYFATFHLGVDAGCHAGRCRR
jgi:hypothetical protein